MGTLGLKLFAFLCYKWWHMNKPTRQNMKHAGYLRFAMNENDFQKKRNTTKSTSINSYIGHSGPLVFAWDAICTQKIIHLWQFQWGTISMGNNVFQKLVDVDGFSTCLSHFPRGNKPWPFCASGRRLTLTLAARWAFQYKQHPGRNCEMVKLLQRRFSQSNAI